MGAVDDALLAKLQAPPLNEIADMPTLVQIVHGLEESGLEAFLRDGDYTFMWFLWTAYLGSDRRNSHTKWDGPRPHPRQAIVLSINLCLRINANAAIEKLQTGRTVGVLLLR